MFLLHIVQFVKQLSNVHKHLQLKCPKYILNYGEWVNVDQGMQAANEASSSLIQQFAHRKEHEVLYCLIKYYKLNSATRTG